MFPTWTLRGVTTAQFGGRVLHEPQVFPSIPQPYFATFWLDPWGFTLEAVCHAPDCQ
jgi:hypothetical protein